MRPDFSHKPRKRFGQNFLQSPHVIHKIISTINAQPNDNLIEIGPGLGALTKFLLAQVNHLNVIEIDRDLASQLAVTLGESQKLTIYAEDVLNFDFRESYFLKNPKHMRIVGNLPYNITTPLIFHLLKFESNIQDMHFMLQKEVVDRLCAQPNCKDYGRLSIMAQYHCETEHLFSVDPSAFYPPPKVNSAFVRLIPRPFPITATNITLLQTVTRDAFNLRRKTLSNALKSYLGSEDFIALDLNPTLRPEVLSVMDFIKISNYIDQKLKTSHQEKS
jgi:16S rRNA (adenine1518-N6/adenine1519-N6)-dimethyltransferase